MPASDQGVNFERYMLVPRTMIIITRGDKILLLKGAQNKRLWAGLYNGIGGHVEKDEDILSSAKRELHEETGLTINNLFLCGIVTVDTQTNPGVCIFIFKGDHNGGDLSPSKEGLLEWIDQTALNDLPLVTDLPALLPRILSMERATQPFIAHSHYDDEDNLVVNFI